MRTAPAVAHPWRGKARGHLSPQSGFALVQSGAFEVRHDLLPPVTHQTSFLSLAFDAGEKFQEIVQEALHPPGPVKSFASAGEVWRKEMVELYSK